MPGGLKVVPNKTLKVGWLPFYNLLPIRNELEQAFGANLEFEQGSPTYINQLLAAGKLDLGLCSSVSLVKNPNTKIAIPAGLSAKKSTKSIYLGFHHEHLEFLSEIKSRIEDLAPVFEESQKRQRTEPRAAAQRILENNFIAPYRKLQGFRVLIPSSTATGASFVRMLFPLLFGERIAETTQPSQAMAFDGAARPIELLVGDEALIRRPQFVAVLDIGEVWHSLTSLPFVISVWQTNATELSEVFTRKIQRCAERAQAKMQIDPASFEPDQEFKDLNGKPICLRSCWKNMDYVLGPKEMDGLLLFLNLIREMNQRHLAPEVLVKLSRMSHWHAHQPSL